MTVGKVVKEARQGETRGEKPEGGRIRSPKDFYLLAPVTTALRIFLKKVIRY